MDKMATSTQSRFDASATPMGGSGPEGVSQERITERQSPSTTTYTPPTRPHSTKHRRVLGLSSHNASRASWSQVGGSSLAAKLLWAQVALLFVSCTSALGNGVIDKLLTIKTCGKPNIQNIMSNVTASPGQSAMFKCQVDMSCIVAYIEWYHEMVNGTEKLIKTASSSGDPHVHVIKQVKDTDGGLYTCIAGNVLGQATASAYLEISAAPPRSSLAGLTLTLTLALTVLAGSLDWRHFI